MTRLRVASFKGTSYQENTITGLEVHTTHGNRIDLAIRAWVDGKGHDDYADIIFDLDTAEKLGAYLVGLVAERRVLNDTL